jgi:hypothetical protein
MTRKVQGSKETVAPKLESWDVRLSHRVEDGGSKLLRNVGAHIPDYEDVNSQNTIIVILTALRTSDVIQ